MPTPFTLEKRFGDQLEAELDRAMAEHGKPYKVARVWDVTEHAIRNQLINFGWYAERNAQNQWVWRKAERVEE